MAAMIRKPFYRKRPDMPGDENYSGDQPGAITQSTLLAGNGLVALAILAILCAVGIGVVLGLPTPGATLGNWLSDWAAVPMQLLAFASTFIRARAAQRTQHPDRRIWWPLAAFSLGSIAATLVWNLWRQSQDVPTVNRSDVLYFLDYAALIVAYLAVLARQGLSLRSRRLWFDALSIYAACVAVMWCGILGPLVPSNAIHVIPWPFAWTYVLVINATLTMASVVWMNTARQKANLWIGLLALAGVLDAAWEIGYVASWLSDRDFLVRFYNFGDVLCFAAIAVAAGAAPRDSRVRERQPTEHVTHRFFPTLMALPTLALVVSTLAVPASTANWTLIGLMGACTALLASRAQLASAELEKLTRELAVREAHERVSELVSESDDLLLVVDSGGALRFASASCYRLAGREPQALLGTQAADLFGLTHRAALCELLDKVKADATAVASIEVHRSASLTGPQVLCVKAVNRCANARIGGYVLTVSDRSEQRTLEQEVLQAAHRERIRFASDIHDGVAQQLTGIALMLQGEIKARASEDTESSSTVAKAVVYLSDAIRDLRRLIRGAAPLLTAGGRVGDALRQLEGGDESILVSTLVSVGVDDLILEESTTEHLYRIAAEAVQNARKHSGCKNIDVTLAANGAWLELAVVDDGSSFEVGNRSKRGFGLKLMEYRAQALGASLLIQSRPRDGTTVTVRMPLSTAAGD